MKINPTFVIEFRQVEQDETIAPSDFHSLDGGMQSMFKILNADTVGQKPSDFSPDRTFWRPTLIRTV